MECGLEPEKQFVVPLIVRCSISFVRTAALIVIRKVSDLERPQTIFLPGRIILAV
jgi:hypothetical protein